MHIDSHQHFWKYHPVKDAWITDEMRLIKRDFLPPDLKPLLQENNIDGCIAVQADQSEQETHFLLAQAEEYDFVKAVVGWIDLCSDNLNERISQLKPFNKLKGFRHIVQAESPGFLLRNDFLKGVGTILEQGYTYDILITAAQLEESIQFVDRFPGQRLVIDHCAKPPIKNRQISHWKNQIKQIASNESVYCKISGLITEADWTDWKEADLYPYLDTVFEAFGPKRLLFGSDWPVMLLGSSYSKWLSLLENYMHTFSKQEIDAVLGNNAVSFYQL